MLSSQGHRGGEWGQRLNGMEKRCDWLITVMEHVATTIGLFTPTLPCTRYFSMHHCAVSCRGVCVCVSVCVLQQ